MPSRLTTTERAFELARTGEFSGATEIKLRLKSEGYTNIDIDLRLSGKGIAKELRTVCQAAKLERSAR